MHKTKYVLARDNRDARDHIEAHQLVLRVSGLPVFEYVTVTLSTNRERLRGLAISVDDIIVTPAFSYLPEFMPIMQDLFPLFMAGADNGS